MKTVDACATLSEDTFPIWGSFTAKSQFSSTRLDTPSPSEPMTSAILPLRFDLHATSCACSLAAQTQKPSFFRRSIVWERFATCVTLMWEIAPAELLYVAALVGDDDAGSPNRLGGAGDGAQVARVGDVVEDDDERRAAVFGSLRVRSFHDSRDIHVVEGLGFRHNALVTAAFGELLETRARHRFHRHVALLRLAQHVLNERIALHIVGKKNALTRNLSAQRFDDGAFALDEISHGVRFRE